MKTEGLQMAYPACWQSYQLTMKQVSLELCNVYDHHTLPHVPAGGGYTKNNVARCWANETAILVGKELSEDLPQNLYQEYYQPDYKLNHNVLSTRQLDNQNTRSQIDAIRIRAMEHLRHLAHTPGKCCSFVGRSTAVEIQVGLSSGTQDCRIIVHIIPGSLWEVVFQRLPSHQLQIFL